MLLRKPTRIELKPEDKEVCLSKIKSSVAFFLRLCFAADTCQACSTKASSKRRQRHKLANRRQEDSSQSLTNNNRQANAWARLSAITKGLESVRYWLQGGKESVASRIGYRK